MPKKNIIAILIALIIVIIALVLWHFHAKNSSVAVGDVQGSYTKTLGKLSFPANADAKYKANASGQLRECLYSCLTKGQHLNSIIPENNCEAMCLCFVNDTMKALPLDQLAGKRTPESQAKAIQVVKECISKFKNK